ncbi:ankyrin repeats (3 copies) domain-containing protein [Sarocladium implicatum]|nr:ankyrin repeats (3 copies) domain-containing protein [Sarocladium implicatum]
MSTVGRSNTRSTGSAQDFSFFEALSFEPQKGPFTLSTTEISPPPLSTPHTQPLQPSSPPQAPLPPLPGAGHDRPRTPHATQLQKAPTISKKSSSYTMSKSVQKSHAKCVEICHNVTSSGDRISVHMLEYLTTVKSVPQDIDQLAHTFLDTCQVLFTLDAGLAECGRSAPALPADVLAELEKKFRVTQSDFQMLDQMLLRLLDYERKGSMGKMRKGLGKMFGDHSPEKVTAALDRTKASLKMGALMFQWSLGEEKVNESRGIGFTGLAAALDRLDGNSQKPKPVEEVTPPRAHAQYHSHHTPQPAVHSHSPLPPTPSTQSWQHESMHHPHSVNSWTDKASSRHESSSTGLSSVISPTQDVMQQYASTRASSIGSNERHLNGQFDRLSVIDDAQSYAGTAESETLLEDVAGVEIGNEKAVRVKVDPFTMPRWQARSSTGSDTGSMKSGLISAIRQKNHKMVEQLLDRGVPPNSGLELPALREAINMMDAESVRLLLLFGADPNEADRDGITPLYACVQRNFLAGAAGLLKYGADSNMLAGADFESPLSAATVAGKVNFVHLLLIYGGDSNQTLSDGNTLMTACINKKTPKKVIDLLLEYGADPDAKNRMGQTALFKAIEATRVDLMESLLKHEANPNLPGPKHLLWPATMYSTQCLQLLNHGADHKKTPGVMELAASINNIDSVKALLKAGVNPNIKKDSVYTPLCSAIRDNRPDIIDLLLKNGADPNTPASEYPAFKCITHKRQRFLPTLVAAGADLNSPKGIVEQAVASNNMEALVWLLDQGLDPNVRNPKGHSALTTAIRENRIEMIDLLLKRGADPNKRGQDWPVCMAVKNPVVLRRILAVLAEPRAFKGVMEMAVAADQLQSVKLLLAAGVSVEDRNGGVFSPLTTAIREDHREIVYFLVNEAGADVNAPGEHLPIIKALRRLQGEDTSIIELLLSKGADPNQMYRGWNAVIQAIQNGDLDVLKLVTAKRVDLNVTDDLGRTVIELANSRGWDEGVAILMEAGGRQ